MPLSMDMDTQATGEANSLEVGGVVNIRNKGFRYKSPLAQVVLVGLVCFCCPGMFNALSGMGGGGQVDHTATNNANIALYTTFEVFGILGGGIYNVLSPHLTLLTGCSTYVICAGSFLYYNHHKDQTFAVISGAILGIGAGLLWTGQGAGLLWTGQGAIMTSYPSSGRKGTYISVFWTIFNFGVVLGGLVPFVLNYHQAAPSVNDGTYIAFMSFMFMRTLLTLAPNKAVRDDGSRPGLVKSPGPSKEAKEVLKLFLNWKMLMIVPIAWASYFFYNYQFNNVNGLLFNLRTRGRNNVFYCGAHMLGSVGTGCLLDFRFRSRRTRGFVGVGIVVIMGMAVWDGELAKQLHYSLDKKPELLDFKYERRFMGPFTLFFC